MPCLVIHEMGKKPRTLRFEREELTAGRSPENDLVFQGATISRRHLAFVREQDEPWRVVCLSSTNGIVVDGVLIQEDAELSEGTEILIGGEVLLVFVEDEAQLTGHAEQRVVLDQSTCRSCGWEGDLSTLHVSPICPFCGSRELEQPDQLARAKAAMEINTASTQGISPMIAREAARRLRLAKRSRIERLNDDGTAAVMSLEETEPQVIAKKGGGLELSGIVFGAGLLVTWNGACYAIESKLDYPSMKINGQKRKRSRLSSGDAIDVGKNRFRFVTE